MANRAVASGPVRNRVCAEYARTRRCVPANPPGIRTAVQNIDATTRDDINESLDDIEASTTDIDDRIKEDCQDTIDNNSCDAIGT